MNDHLTSVSPSRELDARTSLDPDEADFRVKTARAGAWVTVVVCIPALIYALTSPPARRAILVTAWVLTLISGFMAFVLPWRRIVHSRWREAAFFIWTLLDVLLVGFVAVHDGGPASPFIALLFVPVVFVGASYPTWSVNLIAALTLSGYVGLAAVYGESWRSTLLVLGGLGGVALMSWWQARNHAYSRRRLAEASITDPLTGALNRRGFNQAAIRGLSALDRHDTPLALLIIDLDEFKSYNDTRGHLAGDNQLVWVAETIRRTLRPIDSFARIGGDEFAVLLAASDVHDARRVAERIRRACEPRAPHSIGIGTAPGSGRDLDSLYRAADRALYAAKRRHHGADRLRALASDMSLYGA